MGILGEGKEPFGELERLRYGERGWEAPQGSGNGKAKVQAKGMYDRDWAHLSGEWDWEFMRYSNGRFGIQW